jgi:hypothetical protein
MSGRWLSGGAGMSDEAVTAVVGVPAPVLRHLDFSDPPGDMTPERYETLLREAASDAPSEDVLADYLMISLGADLVESHGVDVATARTAVEGFAARLWSGRS